MLVDAYFQPKNVYFISAVSYDDCAETVFDGKSFFSNSFNQLYDFSQLMSGYDDKIVNYANFVKTALHQFTHYKKIVNSS